MLSLHYIHPPKEEYIDFIQLQVTIGPQNYYIEEPRKGAD